METNLKPLLEPRKPKISYQGTSPFDFRHTQANLLAILSKLRTYLTSNALQSNLEILDHFTHQALKQEVHEDLNKLIENYVNHVSQEKLEGFLNSLEKESLSEEKQNLIIGFSENLQRNLVKPLTVILELLHLSVNDREVIEIDHDYIEAKVRKILHFVLYNLCVLRQQPQRILSSYCHVNYENLLAILIKEADVPPSENVAGVVDFSVHKFKEDYIEGHGEIEKLCHQVLTENSIEHNTHHVLNYLQKTLTDIHSGSLQRSVSDRNVKVDYIQQLDKGELRDHLRRSLEGMLKQQIEEKITMLTLALEEALKKTREHFSNLKDYFHTRGESSNYQKLIHGSYEHEIAEAQGYETSKALHTIKIYEDLMIEVFSNLSQLEKSKDEHAKAKEYIVEAVRKQFEELLNNAANSLASHSHVGVLNQDIVLDETHFLNSLRGLIENIAPNAQHLFDKINHNTLREKLNLLVVKIDDEQVVRNVDLKAEPISRYNNEPTPFYLYCIGSQILILQVLDIAEGKGRLFCEKQEDLQVPAGIHRVHLNVQDSLKRLLQTLVECFNLQEAKVDVEATIKDLILTLALFKIDSQVGDEDNIHELVLEKSVIQEFIRSHKHEKVRKVPQEKKEEAQEPVVEDPVTEQPAEEAEKPEEAAVEENKEEVTEQREEVGEEQREAPEVKEEQAAEVTENVVNEEKKEEDNTTVTQSEGETQPTEQDVSEENKTQAEEGNEGKNDGEGEQEDEVKKEEGVEKKEGEPKAAGGGKNKKNKKKKR